jgi:heme-degrading monooxygenase HmoA
MHVQIVTYRLADISESEYLDAAHQTAPRFGSIPGLLAKVWLEDPSQEVYAALYFWEDEDAMERFLRSDLFEATNPEFDDVATDGFAVLENLTRATQPMLDIVEEPSVGLRGAIPMPPVEAPVDKAPTKRAAGTKAAKKKAPAKKAAAKKAAARKAAARKAGSRARATTKKTAGKKSPGKKTPVPSRAAAKRTPRGPAKKAR